MMRPATRGFIIGINYDGYIGSPADCLCNDNGYVQFYHTYEDALIDEFKRIATLAAKQADKLRSKQYVVDDCRLYFEPNIIHANIDSYGDIYIHDGTIGFLGQGIAANV